MSGLGVPEIWRVFNRRVEIWLLRTHGYEESQTSRAFLFVTIDTLNEFLLLGLTEGERKAAQAFRNWIKLHA